MFVKISDTDFTVSNKKFLSFVYWISCHLPTRQFWIEQVFSLLICEKLTYQCQNMQVLKRLLQTYNINSPVEFTLETWEDTGLERESWAFSMGAGEGALLY